MENSTRASNEQFSDGPDNHSPKPFKESVEEQKEDDFLVTKDEKNCDSDSHSEDFSHDEQSNTISNSNSQFYENSDSKIDYAVKIDDNDTLSDIDDIKTDSASADSEDSALGSLPSDSALNDREEEVQDRSEGSDSGIGSDAVDDIKIPSFNLALPCSSSLKLSPEVVKQDNDNGSSNNNEKIINKDDIETKTKRPLISNLKRKCSSDESNEPEAKKRKKNISFDNVTVYYFPRAQGFSCVPSQGGSTLGMEWEHSHTQNFTLAEHALEQRRLHRQILQQLKSERHDMLQGTSLSSSEDSDTEEEASDISESELDLDNYFFLQPVPTRQRRALLRAAGVRKIEGYEKDECRDIRTSREFCGCACKGTCNPENCSCSLAGIKCQVDRLHFPCGCTRDGCCNTTGRIEFNPIRVRTHFIQTLMRIGLEKKNEESQAATKRQWLDAQTASNISRNVTSSYERQRSLNHEDGIVRDVSLTPGTEVKSCVNTSSFNNMHCDINNPTSQSSIPDDNMSYGYRSECSSHNNMNDNNMQYENANNHHNNPYTSNILQGKGPPYSAASTMCFDVASNNIQRFPCDLNYTYEQQSLENQHFKGLQSFSASSFEEFAHSSHMTMFSHYGHMYVPDYLHKSNANPVHEHTSLQYHSAPHNHYEMFKNTTNCANNENKNDVNYTTLMTLPYQPSNNKMQTVENDENWFSHNTLLNLDQSDQTTQDDVDLKSHCTETPTESNNVETIENFGELIKKTMVESVIV